MAALTKDRDTVRRNGDECVFIVDDSAAVFAGGMVCLNAAGKAVPAADTAGLSPVVGVAQEQAAPGEKVLVRRGCFAFDAKNGDAPTRADAGRPCYVADDAAVKKTQETSPVAGIVVDVDDAGVWVKI